MSSFYLFKGDDPYVRKKSPRADPDEHPNLDRS